MEGNKILSKSEVSMDTVDRKREKEKEEREKEGEKERERIGECGRMRNPRKMAQ